MSLHELGFEFRQTCCNLISKVRIAWSLCLRLFKLRSLFRKSVTRSKLKNSNVHGTTFVSPSPSLRLQKVGFHSQPTSISKMLCAPCSSGFQLFTLAEHNVFHFKNRCSSLTGSCSTRHHGDSGGWEFRWKWPTRECPVLGTGRRVFSEFSGILPSLQRNRPFVAQKCHFQGFE